MKTIIYNLKIITKTWLHIWSWNSKVEIWWMDQPVIKDKNWFPFIPASSLKWKLRSLYEISLWENNLNRKKDWLKTFDWNNYDEVSMFFGKAWDEKRNLENLWSTRFIFRDMKLSESLTQKEIEDWYFWKKEFEKIKKSWENIYEEKIEVSIDRFTWTASKSWPRPLERVPAKTIFKWDLIVRLFEKEEILKQWDVKTEKDILEKKFWKNLEKLIKLIENDYLWWQGSRWSWEIEIIIEEKNENNNNNNG